MSRTGAGRDQVDEYGNLIYTDEQIREFTDFFRGYLAEGADYFRTNSKGRQYYNVDSVDLYYDRSFGNAITRAGVDLFQPTGRRGEYVQQDLGLKPDRYIEATGAPEYLLDIFGKGKEGKARVEEEAQSAYAVLSIADSPEQIAKVLGGYYGVDFSPVAQELSRFGGKLSKYTDSSAAQLNKFHSFVEPILTEQITYLQMTRGLKYQDALKAAFNEDPMIQALYGKYDITPIRQTSDGSTYIYDPFSFGEIRTFKAENNSFRDFAKIIASVAVSYFVPGMLSTALGISKAAATAVVAAGQTAVSGGDSNGS